MVGTIYKNIIIDKIESCSNLKKKIIGYAWTLQFISDIYCIHYVVINFKI